MIDLDAGEKLELDAWKLAHHGSKKSTLEDLMYHIKCKQMLISSDGKRYKHPDSETIAKLIKYCGPDLQFHFNFKTKYNEMWDDNNLKQQFKYQVKYGNSRTGGLAINL